MRSALAISEMGYRAVLVEKSGRLGGNALNLSSTFGGRPMQHYVRKIINDVVSNERINVFLNTEIEKIDGYVGNFTTSLKTGNVITPIKHGAVVVAIGAREQKPGEYLYGESPRVITQLELDRSLLEGGAGLEGFKNVVMIQCAGSREEGRMYCSRVCCNQALRNAIALRRIDPEASITILYRDMRSYGLYEDNYRAARNAGIRFIHYDPEKKPVVLKRPDGTLYVDAYIEELGETVSLDADLVVLAGAIVPDKDENKRIAQLLKVPMTQDGFFLEAHVKLRPVDFATEGVFVCGLAHSPRNLRECMIQGTAAAGRAATIIAKDSLETEGTIAKVDPNYCTACGSCEKVCAYGAISVREVTVRRSVVRKAVVNEVLCKGCGTCSANCRCGAIDVGGFSDRQIIGEIEYLLRRKESR